MNCKFQLKRKFQLGLSIIGVVGLLFLVSSTGAQEPGPQDTIEAQAALGTAFTYQGELINAGGPVTGACDFQFSLWDGPAAGAQIGNTQTVNGLNLVNGRFTAQLDFGGSAFNGDARWLQIAVQCSGDNGFTTLSPRQPLTPAPYALALPGLWTQQNATSPNLIGGYKGNAITAGVVGGTIGGGGEGGFLNRVTDSYSTVGGGEANRAGDNAGTINDKSWATVGGGAFNVASGQNATVGGGWTNVASGYAATVAGGANNTASQNYSFAAGNRAKAMHAGAFVWADSTNADYSSTANNQFAIRASNGLILAVDAGDTKTVNIGERYRDNAIIAWAKISASGVVVNAQEFGVSAVNHDGTGVYTIGIDDSALSTGHLIPIAIAEVESGPNSAANARIVSINQTAPTTFKVYINDGNFNLVNNDFVIIVTGR